LGWQLDGKTVFQEDYPNSGPPGVYATLMITTNASTGEIEKRSALKLPNGGYVAVSGTPSSRFGCTRPTPSPTQTPAISREKAIAIAATQIPLDLVAHSAVNADDASGWRVSFQQANTTRQDLAWPDDGKNVFQSEGSANVPPGVFATIVIIVSPSNGEIINRIATNSILLGKPGPVTKTVNQGWWNGWSCNR
jgi:hypothetical protein